MNILVVVDMQNDFIDGSLGTEEAQRIVPEVVKKIQTFDGTVFATRDTHEEDVYKRQSFHCFETYIPDATELQWQKDEKNARWLLSSDPGQER